jgi:hypothetical protein
VCCNKYVIYVRERYKFDIVFRKDYGNVRPFGSRDWPLDRHVIDLAVVVLFLSLVLEILVGASGYGVDGFECQEIGVLLGGLCGLWRWWKYIRFWLWLDYLGVLHRVRYLKWGRRIGDGRLSGMGLARVWV